MCVSSPQEITQLLVAWNKGDLKALEQLAPLVYTELHHLAKRHMAGERPGHILQTTALVNETFFAVDRLAERRMSGPRPFLRRGDDA